MIDENKYKGFWQDFAIADAYGENAIRNTNFRASYSWRRPLYIFSRFSYD